MMHASGRSNRFVLAALALMCVGAIACHEDAVAPRTVDTPQGPMNDLGTLIIDVDLVHHTWKARSVGGSTNLPRGVSAAFYGAPNKIEYALVEQNYSNLPTPGEIEYNIHANFSNLLTYQIGTNSPYTYPNFPQDTLGVYAYFAVLPYNFQNLGGPCTPPACTVSIDSVDGRYPFTSGAPQPYVYWKTILEGGGTNAQGPGPFETDQHGIGGGSGVNYYRRMSFHTHGNMTDFSFGLSMAAPWVKPNESRWKAFYIADSLPNSTGIQISDSTRDLRSEPNWRRLGTTGSSAITPAACAPNTNACKLTLTAAAGDTLIYYRSDSLRADQNGYITATVTASSLTGAAPGVFLGLKDPTKLVELGISTLLTGFTDSTGTLIPAYSVATDLSRTTYRVVKYVGDSASIFSPAGSTIAIKTIPYASLPPAPVRGSGPPNYDRFFFFGNSTASLTSTAATSAWSNVNYEIGATTP